MIRNMDSNIFGTKAETLFQLYKNGFPVPKLYFFSVSQWKENKKKVLAEIENYYANFDSIAIRSSAIAEDRAGNSMAGAFDSVLNVSTQNKVQISDAITKVIASLDKNPMNQVLVQVMVTDVLLSGVIMTKVLDDGSPYYVINYDDNTGKTDTVTNGLSINKTVYIYNGATETDFYSASLLAAIKMVWRLEADFNGIPLDIEFAVDRNEHVHILQVRKITTSNKWNHDANALVSERLLYLVDYVEKLMKPRPNLYGKKTLLGLMPDWNPAEMIGVVPRPLSMSLYRELITRSTWRISREMMGYRKMPNVDLMVSLFGRTYIDVRNSMNSFLPQGLNESIAGKLIDAYIDRLELNPHLHDKIEFDVVHTAYNFEFDEKFNERYPDLLNRSDFLTYKSLLRSLTSGAIGNSPNNSLDNALKEIDYLKELQQVKNTYALDNPFAISDSINSLIGECINHGTIPFSIIARHAFIAEDLLRSAINKNIITAERIELFRRSFSTVAGEMSEKFQQVCNGSMDKSHFLEIYGHLRPSSYDILSPRYKDRKDLFEGSPKPFNSPHTFKLLDDERISLNNSLIDHGFDSINADGLLKYAKKAIVGREYAKFIFTKHLSTILEFIAKWGELQGFDRSKVSMLTLNEILTNLFSPLTSEDTKFYSERIEKSTISYTIASSFKLSYLIRSIRDIYVVPQQRSTPNFVGNKRIEAIIFLLNPYTQNVPNLNGKIVCIEGADPGYDWIFSRDIVGLVTKYGGANSHMAIRCAEYGLPAAIGCGEQPFDRIVNSGKCLLDCQGKRLEPILLI